MLTGMGHDRTVSAVHLSGDVLASGCHDRAVRVWELSPPVSPDGESRWWGARSLLRSAVSMLRVRGRQLDGHAGTVMCLASLRSPGCQWLASGGYEGTVRLWRADVKVAVGVLTVSRHATAPLCQRAYAPTRQLLRLLSLTPSCRRATRRLSCAWPPRQPMARW